MNRLFLGILLFFTCFQTIGQITLLSTDFQSGIPSSYTILNNDGNTPFSTMSPFIGQEAWISLEDPDSSLNQVVAATSYFETADSADRWLITPQITLSSFGNYISWNAKSHDPSYPDDYLVLLSTTGNSPTDFTDTIGSVQEENFEWTNREVDLSSLGLNDSSIYVAFVLKTYDGFKMYLDDILVRGEDASSIEEQEEISVTVYPNPTNGILRVETNSEVQKLEIFSVRGELLVSTSQPEINLVNLNAGSYVLLATTSKGVSSMLVQKVD
jgi:hypothetical protein